MEGGGNAIIGLTKYNTKKVDKPFKKKSYTKPFVKKSNKSVDK